MTYLEHRRLRREKLEQALSIPLPKTRDDIGIEGVFDPWEHVIKGIHGTYSSECDEIMIEVLKAVRDRTTGRLMKSKGFVIEFYLYVLSGHELTEYGTSPRYAWPDFPDLWDKLIEKWEAYYQVAWG